MGLFPSSPHWKRHSRQKLPLQLGNKSGEETELQVRGEVGVASSILDTGITEGCDIFCDHSVP